MFEDYFQDAGGLCFTHDFWTKEYDFGFDTPLSSFARLQKWCAIETVLNGRENKIECNDLEKCRLLKDRLHMRMELLRTIRELVIPAALTAGRAVQNYGYRGQATVQQDMRGKR